MSSTRIGSLPSAGHSGSRSRVRTASMAFGSCRPGPGAVDVLARHGQRCQSPVIQVDPTVPFGVGDYRVAAVAVERGGSCR